MINFLGFMIYFMIFVLLVVLLIPFGSDDDK